MTIPVAASAEHAAPSERTSPFMDLCAEKAGLIAYLLVKVKSDDWHGVADAAMDIREVDAKLDLLQLLGDGQ